MLVLLAVLCRPAVAQQPDSLRSRYDRQVIYMQGSDRLYVKGRHSQLAGGSLRREFEAFPEPLALYNHSRRLRGIATGLSLGATAISLVTIVNMIRGRSTGNYWVWYGLSLALGVGGGVVRVQASNQLNQALWLRNREVLLQPDYGRQLPE